MLCTYLQVPCVVYTCRCLANPKLYFTQLEMRLNGTIQAVVQGGVSKFHEAFLNAEFESQHPEDAIYITQLKELLTEQVSGKQLK
ncbi:hypothetical protein DPMN_122077 [Dreissena polymorpha]|uniref:DOCKER domain-containing protein n=1 Tax=Dreissena polymorpha TaxID=45954 RepID=A0A9D4GRU6_DREPO|nr:hypothetical protein DPMN_122077 [Dreissena polymorpha]